ncbi:Cactin [Wickerhamiella sorbophila]|uniref:Splicing factor Cactin n=1 Tax=Wickerhamiella sorbophila TaxID=45607 RepID=A0A2T0FH13_9ASCO|nr:Cactin [Wickerhamiella sorbophila]PRT54257.1 Cactin [Wickerhamiella sorbophila]
MSDVDDRWLANQDEFELHQLQKSALLRVIDNRATEEDFLCAHMAIYHGGFERESRECPKMANPKSILDNLADDKLIELLNTVKTFKSVDRRAESVEFWNSVTNYLNMRLNRNQDRLAVTIMQPDVDNLMKTKTRAELMGLETEIKGKEDDPEYWNGVLELVQVAKAVKAFDEINDKVNKLVSNGITIPEKTDKSPFKEFILSQMEQNELLFEAINDPGDAEYVARAIVGSNANYQAHNYSEPHLSNLVQGYKFSIYYPRLSDSDTVPKFTTTKQPNGTAELKFVADGYPDIKFCILNEPWDKPRYSSERYRSTFERGVLQLDFRFKFYYYKN